MPRRTSLLVVVVGVYVFGSLRAPSPHDVEFPGCWFLSENWSSCIMSITRETKDERPSFSDRKVSSE